MKTTEHYPGCYGPGADSADNPRLDKPTEPENHSTPPREAEGGSFIASGSVSMNQREQGDQVCRETSPRPVPPVSALVEKKK